MEARRRWERSQPDFVAMGCETSQELVNDLLHYFGNVECIVLLGVREGSFRERPILPQALRQFFHTSQVPPRRKVLGQEAQGCQSKGEMPSHTSADRVKNVFKWAVRIMKFSAQITPNTITQREKGVWVLNCIFLSPHHCTYKNTLLAADTLRLPPMWFGEKDTKMRICVSTFTSVRNFESELYFQMPHFGATAS